MPLFSGKSSAFPEKAKLISGKRIFLYCIRVIPKGNGIRRRWGIIRWDILILECGTIILRGTFMVSGVVSQLVFGVIQVLAESGTQREIREKQ